MGDLESSERLSPDIILMLAALHQSGREAAGLRNGVSNKELQQILAGISDAIQLIIQGALPHLERATGNKTAEISKQTFISDYLRLSTMIGEGGILATRPELLFFHKTSHLLENLAPFFSSPGETLMQYLQDCPKKTEALGSFILEIKLIPAKLGVSVFTEWK